ncbi:MAG: M15 family metallopeptidase, partial [Treponema sp.]|nr:M15 family metallopeptidase [Treponema sp.]
RVRLAGFSFQLHTIAAQSIERVDRDLSVLAKNDAEVRRFLAGISHIGSFNWRPIAGTASRSYHSYGLALDFIAKSWGGKTYYWRNIMNSNENWFEMPYEKRWMVPLAVVEIFEKHGFIWGGKWLYFDTVHFEYRPELLALNPPAEN